MSRWWRAYDDAIDDPKLQRLPGDLFKSWFNLLCLTSKGGGKLPSMDDVAFSLRTTKEKAAGLVALFVAKGLIDRHGDDYAPHNWQERQFKSDTSADRMRRHRERHSDGKGDKDVTSHTPSPPTSQVTRPETEQRQTTEQTPSLRSGGARDETVSRSVSRVKSKGTRLPEDWKASHADAAKTGLSDAEISKELDRFRDWARSASGSVAIKRDWDAAWRNWCRSTAEKLGRSPPKPDGPETGFYAAFGSHELEAWDAYRMDFEGRKYPRDKRGGWSFPTRWPTGYEVKNGNGAGVHDGAQGGAQEGTAGVFGREAAPSEGLDRPVADGPAAAPSRASGAFTIE